MERQAAQIRPEIEMKVEAAFREGAETVLFLSAVASQSSGTVSFWGGLTGFLAAVFVTLSLFVLGKRVPLRL